MKLVSTPAEIQALALGYQSCGLRVGLVPTMGWFHEGHLALMRAVRKRADRVIVSLFVNPIQFGQNEDLENYPHDLDRDCRLAEETGIDVLFAPDTTAMYPEGFASTVRVEGVTDTLCGASRPGHFDGVTTVVAKLFHLTLPKVAIFGEKDFQQLAIIRKMVRDLDFPIEIIGHPIVREENGLAMSSRNTYLHENELSAALSLSQSIDEAKKTVLRVGFQGITVQELKELVYRIISVHPECEVDYIEIVNRTTLQPCLHLSAESILVLAVKINNRIRLIDNSILKGS